MVAHQFLASLPEELLYDILARLSKESLSALVLASKWTYHVATPLLWREVELVDCRTRHANPDEVDEHDDTPLIKKLLVLATNPWIASHVQILTHRCHLPPPAIFNELPRALFSSQTLSTDPRTIHLVRLAAQCMVRLHTLRIIFGHPTLNDALLRCLFDKHRARETPIRRLWLENCRISAGCCMSIPSHPYHLPLELDFDGLESVRLRRLPARPGCHPFNPSMPFYPGSVHARGDQVSEMLDGLGGQYRTTYNVALVEQAAGHSLISIPRQVSTGGTRTVAVSLDALYDHVNRWDDLIYEHLQDRMDVAQNRAIAESHVHSHPERSMLAWRGPWLDPPHPDDDASKIKEDIGLPSQREKLPSADVALALLGSASSTLTSLTFDWLFTIPYDLGSPPNAPSQQSWILMMLRLFELRFPHLRAFQFRNGIVPETLLPQGLYLLDHAHIQVRNTTNGIPDEDFDLTDHQRKGIDLACLAFMEAHPNLKCLAWPMDQFFSAKPMRADIAGRVKAVMENLGRKLLDLRIDTMYSGDVELQSENQDCPNYNARERRRRFVQDFAPAMHSLESIKIEGGMPRDERRETIRALHACPIKKLVIIGICNPVGNTWGPEGSDLGETLSMDETAALQGEHKEAIWQLGPKEPERVGTDFRFEPHFGWPPSPPMIHTIASYHADTVTELKFCGYKGAPVLFAPTPITTPMLAPLKHFHRLQSLIMSFWLTTRFEGESHDSEIVDYWVSARSPASTALVRVTDDEPEGWEKELRTKFAPDALAWRVTSLVGPFLSERAVTRAGGVGVRASFCVGDWGGIFDIDVRIGRTALGFVCLGFSGPSEELEPRRRRSKLDNRRWF